MGTNRQVARNLVFNCISFAVNFGISLLLTPYIIRSVGKEAYGFIPLVNSIIGYSEIISAAIGSMAGRFITMKIYRNDIEGANVYFTSVWVANLFLSAFFTILAAIGIIYLDKFLSIPQILLNDVRWLFGLVSASMIIGLTTGLLGLPTYIKNRVDLSSARNVISNIARVAVITALFVFFKPSIKYIGFAALAAVMTSFFLNLRLKQKLLPELKINPPRYYRKSAVFELTKSGVWNSVNQLSNVLLYQLDLLITNVFIGVAVAGDYSIAKVMPGFILSFLAMLSGTFVPHFNILHAKGEKKEMIQEIKKSMIVVSMIIALPIGFLLAYGDVFFNLWVPGQNISLLYKMTIITLLPMILGGSVNPIFGVFTTTNKLKIPSLVLLFCGIAQTIITVLLLKFTSLGIWAIIIVAAIQSGLRNGLFTPMYGAASLEQPLWVFYPTVLKGIVAMSIVAVIGLFLKSLFLTQSWLSFTIAGIITCLIASIINLFVLMTKKERCYLVSLIKAKIFRQNNG